MLLLWNKNVGFIISNINTLDSFVIFYCINWTTWLQFLNWTALASCWDTKIYPAAPGSPPGERFIWLIAFLARQRPHWRSPPPWQVLNDPMVTYFSPVVIFTNSAVPPSTQTRPLVVEHFREDKDVLMLFLFFYETLHVRTRWFGFSFCQRLRQSYSLLEFYN